MAWSITGIRTLPVSPHPFWNTSSSSQDATGRTIISAAAIASTPTTELTTRRRPSGCFCLRNGNVRSSANRIAIAIATIRGRIEALNREAVIQWRSTKPLSTKAGHAQAHPAVDRRLAWRARFRRSRERRRRGPSRKWFENLSLSH